MRVDVRLATVDDAFNIEPWLRTRDYDELEAWAGPDVLGQLVSCVQLSVGRLGRMAFAVEVDGQLISIFGFIPASALSDEACPWMVGTNVVNTVPGVLNDLGRRYCAAVLEEYPVLWNYVDARNRPSKIWLKRIGFTLAPAAPIGHAGLPFHRFEMRSADVR